MEMRREFLDGDLNYLANLCHSCSACYTDCQFSPPHEFNVNVPRVLAQARSDSYEAYAWPRAFAPMFRKNGVKIALASALSVAVFIIGFVALSDPGALFSAQSGPGAFYRVMPHNTMALIFGVAFAYAIVAMAMGVRAFWRDIGEPASTLGEGPSLWQAMKDASTLRYLDGGGVGCINDGERPTDTRRIYHHFTFYGFLLCFAATSVATFYHYLVGREAPYLWYDLPVLLGTLGGVGLVIGPIGLLVAKSARDPAIVDETRKGMDVAFLVMLLLTSVTGLLLLVLRDTSAMGVLLAVHLGVVFALFITMPYGKFVHGIYRFLALVRYAKEKRMLEAA
jgi:citrate/tricarballylate utilization protein